MEPQSVNSQETKETKSENQLLQMAKWMVVGLTIFFFLASLAQLIYLHEKIAETSELNLMGLVDKRINKASPIQNILPLIELESRVALEEFLIKRRYHQGSVLLMSRIWISYLGFVTGMILCLVGASFIISRIRESVTKLKVDSSVLKFSLAASSPGIILASLGTILIMTSILTNHRISIKDQSIYLSFLGANPNTQSILPSSITMEVEPEGEGTKALKAIDGLLNQ